MFTIIGCLGAIVGSTDNVDEVLAILQQQLPISEKTIGRARKALQNNSFKHEYHVEYGGSGCTIRRS